jgi:hypothetical protein
MTLKNTFPKPLYIFACFLNCDLTMGFNLVRSKSLFLNLIDNKLFCLGGIAITGSNQQT